MADQQPPKDVNDKSQHEQDMGRRNFLKNTGLVAGGLVGGSLFGGLISGGLNKTNEKNDKTAGNDSTNGIEITQARQFFTRHQDFKVLNAATELIFPEDDLGPGAIKLGVPYYIDKQLAGRWGVNARDYRHAPYTIDLKEVDQTAGPGGEQSILDRGMIFLLGLRKMDEESQKRFDVTFDKATEEQQIEIMTDFEANEVKMKGVKASEFFILLKQATLEGAYCDPLYGGNINMEGWKMKEFPGAVASYANYIESDEFAKLDPVSLRDYQGH
ncbi:dehydrogenase [Sporosarcina sp. P3]|uniref:gluconate 2-dehydrogenase subunit 3 family protein n=1 Tax=Sporosarcina sp. P3 TaxID=2048245 RepID=UPI000C172BA4|nr:gluconate 2-dehydrogenase subunit 3 family protein [Sporosarcina sp. P3]PID21079.1 dehydrogenase [Sporosarcina sp. P3]